MYILVLVLCQACSAALRPLAIGMSLPKHGESMRVTIIIVVSITIIIITIIILIICNINDNCDNHNNNHNKVNMIRVVL